MIIFLKLVIFFLKKTISNLLYMLSIQSNLSLYIYMHRNKKAEETEQVA